MSNWLVYIDGTTSRCVRDASPDAAVCAAEGMTLVLSGAASQFEGWTHAAVEFGCIPDDYDDDMRPGVISDPVTLFRSVSIRELEFILRMGAIQGGGNRFNDYDRRPFVFFAGELNDQCIGQGEDATRVAEFMAFDTFASEGRDPGTDRDLLKRIYRDFLEVERHSRTSMTYSSCVIETLPVNLGFHYSLENGKTGMNGQDEFGLFPGQITVEHIRRMHWVKDGKVILATGLEDAQGIVAELADERAGVAAVPSR